MATQRLIVARLSRSLNRLVRRLQSLDAKSPWPLLTLERMPPLLAGTDRRSALGGVIQRVLRVQEHMLAYLDGTLPWDPLRACKALQHLASDTDSDWSPAVKRFAAALAFDLPAAANRDGRVTLLEVDCVAMHLEIDRMMANPRIAWEPRPSMPGWQQGRMGGQVIAYLDVAEKFAWLRWADRDQTEPGWAEKHGSEAAAKLAAERRIASQNKPKDGGSRRGA